MSDFFTADDCVIRNDGGAFLSVERANEKIAPLVTELAQVKDENKSLLDTLKLAEFVCNQSTTEIAALKAKLEVAVHLIREAKRVFAPTTTNSDADEFLKRIAIDELGRKA